MCGNIEEECGMHKEIVHTFCGKEILDAAMCVQLNFHCRNILETMEICFRRG